MVSRVIFRSLEFRFLLRFCRLQSTWTPELGLDDYFRDAGLDEIHREIRETLTGCWICQLLGEAGFAKIWAPMWGWERKRFSGWRRQKFGVRDSREKGSGRAGSALPLSRPWPPGGRGTPLYKPYRYVPPQRVGFLSRFGLKTGIDFVHFGLESGMVFEGTTRTTGMYEHIYRFNSKWARKKAKYANWK